MLKKVTVTFCVASRRMDGCSIRASVTTKQMNNERLRTTTFLTPHSSLTYNDTFLPSLFTRYGTVNEPMSVPLPTLPELPYCLEIKTLLLSVVPDDGLNAGFGGLAL